MTAASPAVETHDRLAAAYHAQRAKLSPPEDMWSGCAGNFKPDLNAPLNPFVAKVASFLQPDDVLIDVGGGAGRISLPLASRCREVICVDSSRGMGDVFEAAVASAGIHNARFVFGGWPETSGIEGDVALVSHVTYFVTDIRPFIEGLNKAARRRVIIGTRSIAPPNQIAPCFEVARGEALAPVPGPDELLAVLDEIGIVADVIDAGPAIAPATAGTGASRDDIVRSEVESAVRLGWMKRAEADRASALFHERFNDLFVETDKGFRRRSGVDARELIITWETR